MAAPFTAHRRRRRDRLRVHLAIPCSLLVVLPAAWHVCAYADDAAPQAARGIPTTTQGSAPAMSFDADLLRAHGLDPALAAYFSQAPRFTPGVQRVALTVNGEQRGSVAARFDDNGKLCFDQALVERAGLVVPATLKHSGSQSPDASSQGVCYDYRAAYPRTVVELDPGANAVHLIVPAEALEAGAPTTVDHYASGGVGGIFNYNLMSMSSAGDGSNSRYLFGDGEIGLNVGDWIVRSRNSYSQQGGASQISNLYTYAQKTFVGTGSMLQFGQINVSGSLFPVPAIIGAQYFPDTALIPAPAGPSFQGVADHPGRIEVRQLGALIYSTVVPAGPYTLSNLPLTSASADLEITVIEADGGATRRYTVPAASLMAGQRAPLGLSIAAGRVYGIAGLSPMVATASKGWNIGSRFRLAGGVLLSPSYQALAASTDATISSRVFANLTATVSNAQSEHVEGVSVSASVSAALTDSLSGSLSATQQTRSYRTLSDISAGVFENGASPRSRSQYTASVNWTNAWLGGFALSYAYGSSYGGPTTQYAALSWNRMFGRVTASVNVQKDLGSSTYGCGSSACDGSRRQGGFTFYATLTIPLGRANVQTFSSNAGGQTRFGTSVSQTVNDYLSYNARAETNPRGNGPNVGAGVSVLPRYTQASISYAQSGSGNSSYMAQVQGGIAATREGVTFSPYTIGDTFGVVSAGRLSGVRISTPQGAVWTDLWGRAVLPVLPAYERSRVEVLTNSLPRNADLNNGIEFVDAGRGSVNFVDFGIVKTRRVLLHVTTPDGKPLPPALPVLDQKNQYVTTSVGDGVVFLSNASATDLQVSLGEGHVCRLHYQLPTKSDPDRPFDAANAVCQQ